MSPINSSAIGEATAKLMDVLEEDHPDAELTYAPVIAEVSFKDSDGDHCSSYRWRSTADSPAMTAGVAYMVVRGATEPD